MKVKAQTASNNVDVLKRSSPRWHVRQISSEKLHMCQYYISTTNAKDTVKKICLKGEQTIWEFDPQVPQPATQYS